VNYELSVAPTTEPLTIEDVQAYCQYGDLPTDQRATVTLLIKSAREVIERRLCRKIISQTWKAYLDEWPDVIEIKDKIPVTAISSITYVDDNGTTQTLSSSLYQSDYASTQGPCRIMPAYNQSWPEIRTETLKPICITFTCGYGAASAVPAAIKNAMLYLIASNMAVRESIITGTIVNVNPHGLDMCLSAEDWGHYS
jgi:uncharacterized phiE125 gp8 family phage protein